MDKCASPSSKHRKNKAEISINIGGLVVLGGALAVTSLIAAAAFAVKRRRSDKKDLVCKKEVKSQSFILQNPSSTFHQNPCLKDGSKGMVAEETRIDSIELVSTERVILEENSASMINGENENFDDDDQEILIPDDPKQEMIITSCDNCCAVEELAFPVLDSKSMNEVEDKIKNDSEENSSWFERIEIKRQEEEVDTERIMEEETKSVNLVEQEEEESERVEEGEEEGDGNEEYDTKEESVCAENLTAETTVAMHLVEGEGEEEEEEEEEDSSEEYVMEERDERSEGTGSTTAENNAEAIWAAESIEVLSQELKNGTINMENSGEKIMEEDGSTKTEEFGDSIEALPLEVESTSVNLQSSESKEKILEEDRCNKTQEFGDFNEAKRNILNDDTDNHETSKNQMSLKKKEMPELVEVNNQTTEPTMRKIRVCSMLLLAFLLLILLNHRSALSGHVLNGSSLLVHEV